MQVSQSNPMVGLEGRASLLTNLGKALKANSEFFGEDHSPGNMIGELSYLLFDNQTINISPRFLIEDIDQRWFNPTS